MAFMAAPVSRQQISTSATCSALGTSSPPQRSFTRPPTAAIAPTAAGTVSRQRSPSTSSR